MIDFAHFTEVVKVFFPVNAANNRTESAAAIDLLFNTHRSQA